MHPSGPKEIAEGGAIARHARSLQRTGQDGVVMALPESVDPIFLAKSP